MQNIFDEDGALCSFSKPVPILKMIFKNMSGSVPLVAVGIGLAFIAGLVSSSSLMSGVQKPS